MENTYSEHVENCGRCFTKPDGTRCPQGQRLFDGPPTRIEIDAPCNECDENGETKYMELVRPQTDDPFDIRKQQCSECEGTKVRLVEVMSCCRTSEDKCFCAGNGKDFVDRDARRIESAWLELRELAQQALVEMDGQRRDVTPQDLRMVLSYYISRCQTEIGLVDILTETQTQRNAA